MTPRATAGRLRTRGWIDRVPRADRTPQPRCRAHRRRFELRYSAIEAERANVKRRYGICYSDGVIKIRLRHAATGRPLKYSSLVNTLCHELAHLRHFNHGPRFKAFYFRLLDFARAEGIYRPGPGPARPPRARPPKWQGRFSWICSRAG